MRSVNLPPDMLIVVGESGVYQMYGLSDGERRLINQHYCAMDHAMETGQTDDFVDEHGNLARGLDYFQAQYVQGVRLATDLDHLYAMQTTGNHQVPEHRHEYQFGVCVWCEIDAPDDWDEYA